MSQNRNIFRNLKHLTPLMLIFSVACGSTPQQTPTRPASTSLPTPETPVGPVSTEQATVPAGTIMLDQTASLSAQGPKAAFNFDGIEGQPVTIDAILVSGTPQFEMRLVDPFGNYLALFESDPALSTETISEITLPYGGGYAVELVPRSGDGSVEVVVTALGTKSGGGLLAAPGASLSGTIGLPHTYHTYQMELTQGAVVTISAKSNLEGLPDTALVLYGPDGRYITDIDDVVPRTDLDAVLSSYVVPITGTYTAIVTSQSATTGAYIFAVTLDTVAVAGSGSPDIVYDTSYTVQFFEGSTFTATFDGTIGDVVRIDVADAAPTVGLDIFLLSPFQQIIGYVVSETKGVPTSINEVQLPYTGRYKLELRPIGDGVATLQVKRLPPEARTGGGVFDSQTTASLPGRFDATNVFHVYQFDASAGDKISLTAFSISPDGKLDIGFAVLGPNGRMLVFADDSESEFPKDPELTNFEALQSGTYTVIVYSFTDAVGSYDLQFKRN